MDKKLEVIKYLRQYYNGNTEALDYIYPLCRLDRESLSYRCDKCVAEIKSAQRSSLTFDWAWDAKQRLLQKYADDIVGL